MCVCVLARVCDFLALYYFTLSAYIFLFCYNTEKYWINLKKKNKTNRNVTNQFYEIIVFYNVLKLTFELEKFCKMKIISSQRSINRLHSMNFHLNYGFTNISYFSVQFIGQKLQIQKKKFCF